MSFFASIAGNFTVDEYKSSSDVNVAVTFSRDVFNEAIIVVSFIGMKAQEIPCRKSNSA
jgi:hypothetical protein